MSKTVQGRQRGLLPPPACHPNRKQVASGMCSACYQRSWKRRHPGKQLAYDQKFAAKDYVRHRERHRWHKIKAQYGLTRAAFGEMWARQLGLCPICLLTLEQGPVGLGRHPWKTKRWNNPRSASVDHDHATGKVRGLLCRQHNAALALFGDNIDYLNRAIEYLARARAGAMPRRADVPS